jgi:hypothetical protein
VRLGVDYEDDEAALGQKDLVDCVDNSGFAGTRPPRFEAMLTQC